MTHSSYVSVVDKCPLLRSLNSFRHLQVVEDVLPIAATALQPFSPQQDIATAAATCRWAEPRRRGPDKPDCLDHHDFFLMNATIFFYTHTFPRKRPVLLGCPCGWTWLNYVCRRDTLQFFCSLDNAEIIRGWIWVDQNTQNTQNTNQNSETSQDSQNPTILVPFTSDLDLIVIKCHI